MKHIEPHKMSRSVRLLWELGDVLRLKPEELAPYIGVSFMTVYRWFRGVEPLRAHERLILVGVERVKAARPDWLDPAAGWGKSPTADMAEAPKAKKLEEKSTIKRHRFFAELEGKSTDQEKDVLAESWPGFVEVLNLAQKYKIKLPSVTQARAAKKHSGSR
jgi:hypothetical protein